jgi:hypothetical protein
MVAAEKAWPDICSISESDFYDESTFELIRGSISAVRPIIETGNMQWYHHHIVVPLAMYQSLPFYCPC